MGFTPEKVAELKALGLTTAAIEAAEKRQVRLAQDANDKAALELAGITAPVVQTLVDTHDMALSTNEDSAWCGFVIGALPFDEAGVTVKIIVTVDNPDAFPAVRDALLARKESIKQARKAKKATTKLSSAPRLTA